MITVDRLTIVVAVLFCAFLTFAAGYAFVCFALWDIHPLNTVVWRAWGAISLLFWIKVAYDTEKARMSNTRWRKHENNTTTSS